MKKILALVLAVVMMVGICAACAKTPASSQTPSQTESKADVSSTAEPKKPVTIRYYYMNGVGPQAKTVDVQNKLNEMLSKMEGYEHISMELVPMTDYKKNFTLDETAGKQIDLVATYGMDFTTAADAGSFIDLKDLLAKHPEITAVLPEWLIEMGKYNGTQYYVPSYQQATNGYFFVTPTAYLDAAKITEDEARKVLQKGTLEEKLDFYEKYVKAVREATGKQTKWLDPALGLSRILYWVEYVDDNYGQLILREGANGPEYWPMTEEAKTVFEHAAKFYQEGLYHPDVATYKGSDFNGKNFMNDESLIFQFNEAAASEQQMKEGFSWDADIPATVIQTSDHWYIGSKWAAGGNAIHSTSKNPEDAMAIVELLMTKKGEEFYNTFIWGLEGVHWEWVDKADKRIKTLEFDGSQGGADGTYTTWKWNVGNTFNAWKNQAVKDGQNEYILNEVHNGKTTVTSPMMGYTWDLASVKDQRADVKAVSDEYYGSLLNGIYGKDWEAKYDEYMTKLKAAGVQEILDTVTKQYNDYTSSKK